MTRSLTFSAIVLMSLAGSPAVSAAGPQASRSTAVEDQAIKQFNDRIEQYMVIRRGLAAEVASPTGNSTAVQITNASDALAAAIRRARPAARRGTFFATAATIVIKHRVSEVVGDASLLAVVTGIDDDGPASGDPTIYRRFPEASQLATMPPAILAVLPPLPKELEYRIIGTFLVLRDIDAAMILDYIPSAVLR